MFGVVKDVRNNTLVDVSPSTNYSQTTYMTAEDINIGIGALLETFEMM